MFGEELARRRQMAHIAATLFGAASVITVLGLALPHQPQVDETGLAVVAALAGIVSAALAAGGKAGGDEMYYLWVALYAAYHFSRVATALHIALISIAYAVTLWAIDPGP